MKKLLLGSTALAVAGVLSAGLMSSAAQAAEPIKVSINGYYQWFFVVGDWDKRGTNAQGARKGRTDSIRQEAEIWFNGITKLDNGTTVGFRIELEAYEFGDQIDEHYLFFSGEWGRIEAGATNGVMSKMVYGAPSAMPGFGFNSQNFNFHAGWPTANTSFSTAIQDDRHNGDANKISYFTPRFSGFQLGVSYTPEFQPGLNGNLCGATGGSSTSFGVCTKKNEGQWQHAFQVAANYLATFNSVNLALYGGLLYAKPEVKNAAVTVGGLTGPARNWWHWLLGINVGVQGFNIGGNIGRDNNGIKHGNTWIYAVSATYTTGPWQFGGGWRQFNRNVKKFYGFDKNDKTNYFELGGNYVYGPGMRLVGGLTWHTNSGDKDGGLFPNVGKDSWQFVLGTSIAF